ncbi:Crp/Fnr family transcriptional regulator [Acetobacterium sp.]|uniref:Crp/Fnr family transcriptional regulator n=1 Tax=Acetobacterium sp. TaxID=1872094 RepID=UPI0035931CD4
MEKFYGTLEKSPLFDNIKADEFKVLMTCINGNIRKFSSDDYVFLAGSQISFVGIVLTGAVEIIKENPAGARLIMDVLGPAHIFGEGIVCTKARIAPVSVRVKEESQILLIPFERIIRTCGNACNFHFQLIQNMMMLLGEKNFRMNSKIELLMLKGMREKLATYLIQESQTNNSRSFDIVLNRNELAEYLNVSRTAMSRELSRMKDEGLLDYYQNSFRILDLDQLKDCLMI